MKLEQALEEYEKRRNNAKKEVEKIRKRYNKRLEKKLREVLKRIDSLERKEIPKNVDDNIRKIVTAERKSYVTSLRKALESIETMEDLGKRLPDLSKLHVGHGRYLIILFEKDVYAINRLLKELNEEYVNYYEELSKKELKDLEIRKLIEGKEETRRNLSLNERERRDLQKKVEEKKAELEEFYREQGLEELEKSIRELSSRIRKEEIKLRSKASKLQKPVKRMRLHEGIASEFIGDSSVVLKKPEEFISLLQKIYPRLEGKHKKIAQWLIENLPEKSRAIKDNRKKLAELERKREQIIRDAEARKKEIHELERLIEEKEAEIKKLKRQLEHLEEELEKSLRKLEEILGEKIER